MPENRSDRKNKTLVLGLGNEVLGDEGLGLILVNKFAERKLFPETDYKCAFVGGLNLLDYITGYDSLFIIDTACGDKGNEGTVRFYNRNNFRETLHISSQHDAPFLTSLEAGERLGFKIPGQIFLIAVEIYCNLNLTEKLSDNINGHFDKIQSEIINFIKNCVSSDPE